MTTPRDSADLAQGEATARWLRGERAAVRNPLLRAALLGTLAAILLVPQAWLLAHAISEVVMHGVPPAQALPWLAPIPPILVVRFVLAQAAERVAFEAGATVKADVRDRVVRHLQALGPKHTQGSHASDAAVAALDAVDALEPYYTRYLPHMALVAALPLAILAFVFPHDWISGLVLLLTAPVIPAFMVLIGRGAEQLSAQQWQKLARMSARFLDALRGITTLKLLDAVQREAELIARLSDDYRRSTMAVLRVAFLSALALEFFATVGIAVVAVIIGFRLLAGSLAFEAGFLILLLAPEFYLPLRQMGAHYHARMEATAAAAQVLRVLDAAPVLSRDGARTPLAAPIGLRFDDVHFAYEPGREALRGATFTVPAQRVTALVGTSGAGKSTALGVVLGFLHPQRGRVLACGLDLFALDSRHWLDHVAWLPQRPHLFAGSILDNIRMGDPGIGTEAVRAAARRAHAEAFIERLPRGYDTALGEHGHTLSGGEAQRIALARAFLKDAPLLLVDEATANLDGQTEARVADALARLSQGRTVLVIAHRMRTVRGADHVVVLDAGRVVEEGPPAALEGVDSRFARMLAAPEIR